jgi:hypothetical protein
MLRDKWSPKNNIFPLGLAFASSFADKVVAGGGAQQRIQTKVSNQQCHSVAKHYEIVGGIYQGLTVY